jgi:hypothetical protein
MKNLVFAATSALAIIFTNIQVRADDTHCREWEPVYTRIRHSKAVDTYEKLVLKTNVYDVTISTVTENRTYPEYNCDTEEGDGSGNWHGFWSAPQDEKADRLSAAVAGMNIWAAKVIVDSDIYFKSKPGSWNAFKNQIREISEDADLGLEDLYNRVIIDNGRINADNLGYSTSESCHWEDVTKPVTVIKKTRKLRKTVSKKIALKFDGGLLLSNEIEEFNVGFDGLDLLVSSVTAMNKYELITNEDESEYLLKATSRIRVTPNATAMRSLLTKESDTLVFKVGDTMFDELRSLYRDAGVHISYQVINTSGWFNNIEAEGTIDLREAEAAVDLKTHPRWEKPLFGKQKTLVPGRTYKVRFRFKRSNTDTFNDYNSQDVETSEITY